MSGGVGDQFADHEFRVHAEVSRQKAGAGWQGVGEKGAQDLTSVCGADRAISPDGAAAQRGVLVRALLIFRLIPQRDDHTGLFHCVRRSGRFPPCVYPEAAPAHWGDKLPPRRCVRCGGRCGRGEPAGRGSIRWFTEWTEARVWVKLHRLVLDELGSRGGLDRSWCAIDSVSVRALKGGS